MLAKAAPHQRMSPRLILQLDAGFFTSNPHEALMYWILPALCCLIPRTPSGPISYAKGQRFARSVRDDLSAEDRGPGSLLQDQRRYGYSNRHYVRWASSGWCTTNEKRPYHLLVGCGGSAQCPLARRKWGSSNDLRIRLFRRDPSSLASHNIGTLLAKKNPASAGPDGR